MIWCLEFYLDPSICSFPIFPYQIRLVFSFFMTCLLILYFPRLSNKEMGIMNNLGNMNTPNWVMCPCWTQIPRQQACMLDPYVSGKKKLMGTQPLSTVTTQLYIPKINIKMLEPGAISLSCVLFSTEIVSLSLIVSLLLFFLG